MSAANLRLRATAAGVMVAAVSCCADAFTPANTTLADSAGVRIVTNLAGSIESAEQRSLASEPAMEIGGGASPDVPLHRITSVLPLEGGRVLVGTNSPPRGLLFGAGGNPAATYGQRGEGPGEFSGVASVVPIGADSVAVWDPDRRRMSVFAGRGDYARDVDLSELVPFSPLAAPSTQVPAAFTYLLPAATDGLILFPVAVWGPDVPETGRFRQELPAWRIGATGDVLATFGPFPGMELYVSPATGVVPFPFGTDSHATMSGGDLVTGTGESPEIRFFGEDGALERIVRWPGRDRAVAGDPLVTGFDAWLARQLEARDPREARMWHLLSEMIPRPQRFPAFAGIIGDDTGTVWVGEYAGQLGLMGLTREVPRVPARRWLVFTRDGVLVATVRTPEGFEPHAVRDGRVWGVYRDELDVESVRAYAIIDP